MKTAFFGTPEFSIPSLLELANRSDVKLVVTSPDVRRGRGKRVKAPPIKQKALELGLRVVQPYSLRDLEFLSLIAELDLDLGVVVAFGRILGRRLLRTPRLGFVNVHASILPKLRGAAPINRAIMEGHEVSGVSLMRMRLGLDKGPVYLVEEFPLRPGETAGSLHDELSALGASALGEFLKMARDGELPEPRKQDHSQASYAEKITAEDSKINWDSNASVIDRQIRGLSPRPAAWTSFRGKRLRVLGSELVPSELVHSELVHKEGSQVPGSLIVEARHPLVCCRDGYVKLLSVQLQGKSMVSGVDFVNGQRVVPGERLQ